MEKKYRAIGTRATRGITGISMGGYGALRLAFKYPDQFAAVSAQMPALISELPADVSSGSPGSAAALLGDVFGSPLNREFFTHNTLVLLCQDGQRRQPEAHEDLLQCRQQRRLRL